MRMIDIIEKVRDKQALSETEINWFIKEYTQDRIPDYQAAAWLMAVMIQGLSRENIVALTLAMAHSGEMLDLSDITDYAIDKHSSGGVGDKTTLIVLPIVASLGIPVAKMSGRGLGFSGGTLDKLEAIAGFNVNLTDETFRRIARENGLVLAGQTGDLAPADGKIYALRDVTATVPSTALIASSIMSKKLAAGAKGIVLDVKVGSGAFMTNLEEARQLARTMVEIGVDAGRDMVALISDMNQPLGDTVGNALEVREAIECLQGGGPADLREHCLVVSSYMLHLAGRNKKWLDIDAAKEEAAQTLADGSAFEKFRQMVIAQGGDVSMVDDPSRLPSASIQRQIEADQSAYIQAIRADKVAISSLALGAGREKKGDAVDPAVGIEVHVSVGDAVEAGQALFTIHANSQAQYEEAEAILKTAIQLSANPVEALPLFYDHMLERPS